MLGLGFRLSRALPLLRAQRLEMKSLHLVDLCPKYLNWGLEEIRALLAPSFSLGAGKAWTTPRFNSISSPSVHIERLRAFGIATFDDTAAILLSGWLQGRGGFRTPRRSVPGTLWGSFYPHLENYPPKGSQLPDPPGSPSARALGPAGVTASNVPHEMHLSDLAKSSP